MRYVRKQPTVEATLFHSRMTSAEMVKWINNRIDQDKCYPSFAQDQDTVILYAGIAGRLRLERNMYVVVTEDKIPFVQTKIKFERDYLIEPAEMF